MKWKDTKKEVKNEEKKEIREYYFTRYVTYKGTQYEPGNLYTLEESLCKELLPYLLCKNKYPVLDSWCGCKK